MPDEARQDTKTYHLRIDQRRVNRRLTVRCGRPYTLRDTWIGESPASNVVMIPHRRVKPKTLA